MAKRRNVSKAALINRNAALERKAAVPGSVVVYFHEPIVRPRWRRVRESDRMRIYHRATAEIVPTQTSTLLRISQEDEKLGILVYLLDWDNIERVVTATGSPEATDGEEA